MPLIQRTLKVVVATCLAIWLATWLGLSHATSAGIIAILSLLDTRKTSLETAWKRSLSAVLGLGLAWGLFALFGHGLGVLGLYLMLFVPLSYHFHLVSGLAPSTVLVTHLYLDQPVTLDQITNEVLLFVIGAGLALLSNLYMPSKQTAIETYHLRVEKELRAIILRFRTFLLEGDGTNDAKLITELDKTLKEAQKLVVLDRYNQVFKTTDYHVHYFSMRAEQNRILRQMAGIINRLALKTPESVILAQLFQEVANQISQENSGLALLKDIDDFLETFRERDLPKTRQEFENRAILFQLLNDLKLFIEMKVDFYHEYQKG